MAGQLGPGTRIGRLRQWVTIQTLTTTGTDGFGARTTNWTNVDTVRAEVVPTGGREAFQNGTVQAVATHRVRMRYRSDLNPAMRLIWVDTGTILNIAACPPAVGVANVSEVWCYVEA